MDKKYFLRLPSCKSSLYYPLKPYKLVGMRHAFTLNPYYISGKSWHSGFKLRWQPTTPTSTHKHPAVWPLCLMRGGGAAPLRSPPNKLVSSSTPPPCAKLFPASYGRAANYITPFRVRVRVCPLYRSTIAFPDKSFCDRIHSERIYFSVTAG